MSLCQKYEKNKVNFCQKVCTTESKLLAICVIPVVHDKWFFFHRFYLGLALALQKNGPGARAKETISYLLEAMETLLTQHTKTAMTPDDPR